MTTFKTPDKKRQANAEYRASHPDKARPHLSISLGGNQEEVPQLKAALKEIAVAWGCSVSELVQRIARGDLVLVEKPPSRGGNRKET